MNDGDKLLTGDEVLERLRLDAKAPRVTLFNLRRAGLCAIQRGNGFVYSERDLQAFIDANRSEGITRVSQVALRLRLQPKWLATEIREGRLPGFVGVDGQVYANGGEVRRAMAQQEAEQALQRAKAGRGK